MPEESTINFSWRPLGLDDLSRISDWFWESEDIALFDRSLPVPISIDGMRERWRTSLEYSSLPQAYWFIAEDERQEPAGIAGLEAVNYVQGDAILPAFVGKEFRGMGLATVMTLQLVGLAFETLRLHRLTTYYRDDNTATQHALSRVGFKEEGRYRESWFADGTRRDTIIVGLLASEWSEARETVIKDVADTTQTLLRPTSWKVNRG